MGTCHFVCAQRKMTASNELSFRKTGVTQFPVFEGREGKNEKKTSQDFRGKGKSREGNLQITRSIHQNPYSPSIPFFFFTTKLRNRMSNHSQKSNRIVACAEKHPSLFRMVGRRGEANKCKIMRHFCTPKMPPRREIQKQTRKKAAI